MKQFSTLLFGSLFCSIINFACQNEKIETEDSSISYGFENNHKGQSLQAVSQHESGKQSFTHLGENYPKVLFINRGKELGDDSDLEDEIQKHIQTNFDLNEVNSTSDEPYGDVIIGTTSAKFKMIPKEFVSGVSDSRLEYGVDVEDAKEALEVGSGIEVENAEEGLGLQTQEKAIEDAEEALALNDTNGSEYLLSTIIASMLEEENLKEFKTLICTVNKENQLLLDAIAYTLNPTGRLVKEGELEKEITFDVANNYEGQVFLTSYPFGLASLQLYTKYSHIVKKYPRSIKFTDFIYDEYGVLKKANMIIEFEKIEEGKNYTSFKSTFG